jgi:MFS family permease
VFFIGAIIAAWAAFGTLGLAGNWSWRACTILQAAIPAFSMVLLTIMPESPRWFVARGRVPEAHAMLAKYHANGDMDDPLVRAELSEIVAAIQLEKTQAGVGAFFRTRGNRHRFFIVIVSGFGWSECWNLEAGAGSRKFEPLLESAASTLPPRSDPAFPSLAQT